MDGSAVDMVLDEKGVCNFCHDAQRELKMAEQEKPNLDKRIKQIKSGGEYDCLLGLSGGVDSSTVLHNTVKLGLKPLCYTIDNGWNRGGESDENILRMVEKLKVPFFRYTIDLDKFRELQSAFMKAGLKNIEIPTDHILMASAFEMAAKYKIKWILSGGNVATESIMPPSWGYNARDLTHIKDVYKKMTGKRLKGLPLCGIWKWNFNRWVRKVKTFYLLDYLDYNREESIKMLEKEYGYKPYGEKHCESIFTWWFQNFYLYEIKNIDKRKAHYASLINSHQMTRKEAMIKLQENPIYPHLGIEELVKTYKQREHSEFAQDVKIWNFLCSVVKLGRKVKGFFV